VVLPTNLHGKRKEGKEEEYIERGREKEKTYMYETFVQFERQGGKSNGDVF